VTVQPFSDPITGGGILVQPEIRSPDFVHLVSGWRLGADGTLEAQSIIVPPGSGGTTVFVQGTPPVANNTGDIWFNSASGFEASQWDGSAWVPFQYGTSAIASGSITAALIAANTITAAQIAAGTITAAKLAAGIVVAGIVDATTITGARIINDGTSGEYLAYSGTPAAGNLIASVSPVSGTDSFGNAYLAGVTAYGSALHLFAELAGGDLSLGSQNASSKITNVAVIQLIDALLNGIAPELRLTSPLTSAGAGSSLILSGESADGSQPATWALSPGGTAAGGVHALAATPSGAPPAGAETWHSLGTLAGYTVTVGRYKLTPENEVVIDIQVTAGGANASSVSFSNTMPAAYQTLVARNAPLSTTRNVTGADPWPRLFVAAGVVSVIQAANTTATLGTNVRLPLD